MSKPLIQNKIVLLSTFLAVSTSIGLIAGNRALQNEEENSGPHPYDEMERSVKQQVLSEPVSDKDPAQWERDYADCYKDSDLANDIESTAPGLNRMSSEEKEVLRDRLIACFKRSYLEDGAIMLDELLKEKGIIPEDTPEIQGPMAPEEQSTYIPRLMRHYFVQMLNADPIGQGENGETYKMLVQIMQKNGHLPTKNIKNATAETTPIATPE